MLPEGVKTCQFDRCKNEAANNLKVFYFSNMCGKF